MEVEIVTKLNLLLEWQKSSVEFHRFSKKFEEYIAVHPSDWVKMKDGDKLKVKLKRTSQPRQTMSSSVENVMAWADVMCSSLLTELPEGILPSSNWTVSPVGRKRNHYEVSG